MIVSITFKYEGFYDDLPSKQLEDWSRGRDREDMISVTMSNDGSITVFYWLS